MSERVQTLVACDRCGRGYPIRDMPDLDGELWCAECCRQVNEQLMAEIDHERHDCDKGYRSDCARCNGVNPGDVGTW